jgi:hypothetical protein
VPERGESFMPWDSAADRKDPPPPLTFPELRYLRIGGVLLERGKPEIVARCREWLGARVLRGTPALESARLPLLPKQLTHLQHLAAVDYALDLGHADTVDLSYRWPASTRTLRTLVDSLVVSLPLSGILELDIDYDQRPSSLSSLEQRWQRMRLADGTATGATATATATASTAAAAMTTTTATDVDMNMVMHMDADATMSQPPLQPTRWAAMFPNVQSLTVRSGHYDIDPLLDGLLHAEFLAGFTHLRSLHLNLPVRAHCGSSFAVGLVVDTLRALAQRQDMWPRLQCVDVTLRLIWSGASEALRVIRTLAQALQPRVQVRLTVIRRTR